MIKATEKPVEVDAYLMRVWRRPSPFFFLG